MNHVWCLSLPTRGPRGPGFTRASMSKHTHRHRLPPPPPPHGKTSLSAAQRNELKFPLLRPLGFQGEGSVGALDGPAHPTQPQPLATAVTPESCPPPLLGPPWCHTSSQGFSGLCPAASPQKAALLWDSHSGSAWGTQSSVTITAPESLQTR